MHPLLSLSIFWLLPLALTLEEDSPLDRVPRKFVPYDGECCYLSCVTLAHSVSTHFDTHTLCKFGQTHCKTKISSRWFLNDKELNQPYVVSRGQHSPV